MAKNSINISPGADTFPKVILLHIIDLPKLCVYTTVPRWPRFYPRPSHVEFLVDKVGRGRMFC
jgi:hypothetical protein